VALRRDLILARILPPHIRTHTCKRGADARQRTPFSRIRTSGVGATVQASASLQKLIGIGGRYFDELTLSSEDEVPVVYFDVMALFADRREYLKQVAASAKPPATDD
jgi:hypothetical protein